MAATTKLGISMPILNQRYEMFPQMANLADAAGFDSVWDYEFYRNPWIIHGLCAQVTKNITLATGLAASAARSPYEMANAAADVDELSGGRTLIGMSTGGAGFADLLNGTEVDHPVPRLREYITIMRQVWDHLGNGTPAEFNGTYYRFNGLPMNPYGLRPLVRPRIPIYLGALQPAMLRLAGEMADGVLGFLVSPQYAAAKMLPEIATGAARAGRDPSEIELTLMVLCSVDTDRAAARRLARINVGMYTATPQVGFICDFMGLTEDRNAVLQGLMTQGPAALEHVTSDALLDAFSISGTPDEAREQLQPYLEVIPHIILHTPYMPPIQGHESERAFRNTVKAFAR